jgi:hypothetical protein
MIKNIKEIKLHKIKKSKEKKRNYFLLVPKRDKVSAETDALIG